MGFLSDSLSSISGSAGGIFSAGLGALGSITGSLISAKSYDQATQRNKEMNAQNIAMQEAENEKNRQWQKEENEIARAREDNAYTRAVNDAMQAGLSPLVVNNGASAQSMQAATGVAPQNTFKQDADTITSQIVANTMKNAIDAFNTTEKIKVENDLMKTQANKTQAEAESIKISNSYKVAEITSQLEKTRTEISKLTSEIDKNKYVTDEQKIKLKRLEERLDAELALNVARANETKTNIANAEDAMKSRELQRDLDRYDYELAKEMGAPVHTIPSSLYGYYATAVTNAAKNVENKVRGAVGAWNENNKNVFRNIGDYVEALTDWKQEREKVRGDAYQSGKDVDEALDNWEKSHPRPRFFKKR